MRGARSGLASRGVAATVLSGAVPGHDRVRDGSGWSRYALGHGHPASSCLSSCPLVLSSCAADTHHDTACPAARPRPSRPWHHVTVAPPAPASRTRPPRPPQSPARPGSRPASTIRTRQLQSVARCPPRAYPPGGLPGVSRAQGPGRSRLGAGFPLRCLQRFALPHVATQRCRLPDNWLTSGASIPVLSY